MTFPIISIVTPTFNSVSYLARTMESVLAQAGDFELRYHIQDGGSTDGTAELVRRQIARIEDGEPVGCRGVRMSFAREPDNGMYDAISKGFEALPIDGSLAMGWLNSDDLLAPGALQTVVTLLNQEPRIRWLTGRTAIIDRFGSIIAIGRNAWFRRRLLATGAYDGRGRTFVQQEGTFWRPSLWGEAGGLSGELKLAGDWDLWRRFAMHDQLVSVDTILAYHRQRPGQLSAGINAYHGEVDAVLATAPEPRLSGEDDGLSYAYDYIAREWRNVNETGAGWPTTPAGWQTKIKRAAARRTRKLAKRGMAVARKMRRSLDPARARDAWHAPLPIEVAPPSDMRIFKDTHKGRRCFIMGNGPSLNRTDLSRLSGEHVFACNAAFLLFDRISWRPDFFVCVDGRVILDRAVEITRMLDDHPQMTGFFPRTILAHDGSMAITDTRRIIPPGPNRRYFNEVPNDLAAGRAFSLDVQREVIQPYTVAITMMQLAAYMGFDPIYLIGCDTSYTIPAKVSESGPELGGRGLLLTSTEDDDPNHFDPSYFGKGRQWHNPQVDKMIEHHGLAKQMLDEAGISVFNATVGGALEIYPRIDFDTLFEG